MYTNKFKTTIRMISLDIFHYRLSAWSENSISRKVDKRKPKLLLLLAELQSGLKCLIMGKRVYLLISENIIILENQYQILYS